MFAGVFDTHVELSSTSEKYVTYLGAAVAGTVVRIGGVADNPEKVPQGEYVSCVQNKVVMDPMITFYDDLVRGHRDVEVNFVENYVVTTLWVKLCVDFDDNLGQVPLDFAVTFAENFDLRTPRVTFLYLALDVDNSHETNFDNSHPRYLVVPILDDCTCVVGLGDAVDDNGGACLRFAQVVGARVD